MVTLSSFIPDVDVLLSMPPEELASFLLKVAVENSQKGRFAFDQIPSEARGLRIENRQESKYPPGRMEEVDLALGEAWNWLHVHGLILPAFGLDGRKGWMVLSRRGKELLTNDQSFERYRQAVAFPKRMLHPSIADQVWLALARGDLDVAVFQAFKAVEEAVRDAGGYKDADVGTDLMRRAFNGPLINQSLPKAEQEALAHLFAGAIGSYKNPHSHRTVRITDPYEAQEMVLLASHLLRIVDARRELCHSGTDSARSSD